MVNLYWNLTLGMIIWAIWKEQNRHIFRNESIPEKKDKGYNSLSNKRNGVEPQLQDG
jgi:hypothetical protein